MAEIYRRDEKKKSKKKSKTPPYPKDVLGEHGAYVLESSSTRSEKKKFNYTPLKKVKSKK